MTGTLRTPRRLACAFPVCKALSYLLPVTMDERILEVSFLHCLVPPGTEDSLLIWDLSDLIVQPSQSILTLIEPLWYPHTQAAH